MLPAAAGRPPRAVETEGLLLLLASAVAYGALPVLAKLAYRAGVGTSGLLAWRFLTAALLFAALAGGAPRPPLRRRLALWGLGLVFVGNSFAYLAALRTAPAAVVALLLYTYPVLVLMLSAASGLEPLTLRAVSAAGLVFAGAALTAGGALSDPGGFTGVALGLASAAGYAAYIVLGSRWAAGVSSQESARHVAEACAAVSLLAALATGELALPASPAAWGAIAAIALLCTVFAQRAFLAGLARVGPGRAAVTSAVEAVAAVGLAVAVLGEQMGAGQWLGGGLVLAGVALHSPRPGRAGGRA